MKALVLPICAAVVAPALLLGAYQSQSTLASNIWVTVNVVHQDGRMVTNLTATDFEVLDNGEKRPITTFRNDPIPMAVAIMVDVSSSMEGNYGLIRRAVTALTSHFEAGDRAILGAFNALPWITPRFSARPDALQRSVAELFGGTLPLCDGDWIDKTKLTRAVERQGSYGATNEFARRLQMSAGSAIWDGAACGINAVASDGETPRRVVVLVTDGIDNMSFTTVPALIDRARRYGVMIYAVSAMGGYGMAGSELKGLAEQTGGGYFYLTGENQVADAFTRIGDELRHQYVFGFEPVGSVNAPHKIEVRSLAPQTTARYRRVFMEAPPLPSSTSKAAPPRAPEASAPLPPGLSLGGRSTGTASPVAPPPPTVTRTPFWDELDQFRAPYLTGGVSRRRTLAELRSLVATLRRDGVAWIRGGPAPDHPGRRLTVATFVLDVLYGQNDPFLWTVGQPNLDLMDWASSVLEAGPPTPEERLWYLGALALFERGGSPDPFERFVLRATQRFPDEPRFALARAIAMDLRTWPEERDVRELVVPPAVAARIVTRYEEAAKLTPVAVEAQMRLAYFDVRRGRVDAALDRFAGITLENTDDPILRFWLRLLKGRAFQQANRLAEAIEQFQHALVDVPGAPSARSALVASLVQAGRGAEAARVAARALSTPAAEVDPWTIYVLPDMRFWAAITRELRTAVTR
jgi:Ca-activated chloride channel family protein